MTFSAVTLFCEDVRAEVSGAQMIVGILPDNVLLPGPGVMIPRLALYTRIVMPANADHEDFQIVLCDPTGEEHQITKIEPKLISETKRDNLRAENPIATFFNTTKFSPFQVPALGRFLVMVRSSGIEVVSGTVLFADKLPDGSRLAADVARAGYDKDLS